MNVRTVQLATQGVLKHLRPVSDVTSVVVGHDHRHNSEFFAQTTAAVFLSSKVKVYYMRSLAMTPLVPFAVGQYRASAGIMITASHNPKEYNGYKLYAHNGCQIISPVDSQIEALILGDMNCYPLDLSIVDTSPLCIDPTDEILSRYYSALLQFDFGFSYKQSNLKICYTPMQGVGLPFLQEAFKTLSLPLVHTVPAQAQPDPDFSTLKFPNPEEHGSLDLAMQHADSVSANVIFANDPDADRFGFAEKIGGEWRAFTGNEIGALLCCFMIELEKQRNNGVLPKMCAILTTTVSSHLLEEIARQEGIRFEETLTGFKWLGNKALELEAEGYKILFAFEEAIGFMVGSLVHDKDGVSAATVFAQWCHKLYADRMTVMEYLEKNVYAKYGYFVSNNGYVICRDPAKTARIFDKIRFGSGYSANDTQQGDLFKSLSYPKEIGGQKVVATRDLTIGYDSTTSDMKPRLPTSKSSQMVTFKLENSALITLRTSGTEPKIKYYSEYRDASYAQSKATLDSIVDSMVTQLLDPIGNNLERS